MTPRNSSHHPFPRSAAIAANASAHPASAQPSYAAISRTRASDVPWDVAEGGTGFLLRSVERVRRTARRCPTPQGVPHAYTFVCPPDPTAPHRARRFVAAVLHSHERDGLINDAELCTSELVTNAWVHARQGIVGAVLRITVDHGTATGTRTGRIRTTDTDAAAPTAPFAAGGGGKAVRCELGRTAATPPRGATPR